MNDWSTRDIPSQAGLCAVVTGTGGIGFETALALGRAGAEVVVAGRDEQKGREAVTRIQSVSKSQIVFESLDLADLTSVSAFAERILAIKPRIHLLVNNAGVMMPKVRSVTRDGFERQFGVNHLGHFALTGMLLPALKGAKRSRVVTVSSGAHLSGKILFDDLQLERAPYKAYVGYQQSKLANVLFARALQRRSDEAAWGLTSVAAHPGYARTNLMANGPGHLGPLGIVTAVLDRIGLDAAGGALSILYAATSQQVEGASYYGPKWSVRGAPALAKMGEPALDDAVGERLWSLSERLTHIRFQ